MRDIEKSYKRMNGMSIRSIPSVIQLDNADLYRLVYGYISRRTVKH